MKINPPCTYTVERAAARWNNGRRSPDARCFDRPHSSFLLCINYVVCTVCVLVRKWMGNAIFRKDFIQFVQHYPSTSVSYMTDSTILVWRLLLLLFPAAVAAVWQKNSPLLYCLDVLMDHQKKLIHAISILKSVNLQYNTLVRWVAGTNDSLTKPLMFQEIMKKNNAWNIRCLVDESFIPSPQHPSILYWRLSDF